MRVILFFALFVLVQTVAADDRQVIINDQIFDHVHFDYCKTTVGETMVTRLTFNDVEDEITIAVGIGLEAFKHIDQWVGDANQGEWKLLVIYQTNWQGCFPGWFESDRTFKATPYYHEDLVAKILADFWSASECNDPEHNILDPAHVNLIQTRNGCNCPEGPEIR